MLPNSKNSSPTTSQSDPQLDEFLWFLFISFVSLAASIGNIFTICAICIDDLLRKKGNSFLVCISLADLLMTGLVIPSQSVAMLARVSNSESICRFQYSVGYMSCLTAAMSTAAVGIENCLRLKAITVYDKGRRRPSYDCRSHLGGSNASRHLSGESLSKPKLSACTYTQVIVINLSIWISSGIFVLLHLKFLPHFLNSTCTYEVLEFSGSFQITYDVRTKSVFPFALCVISFIILGGYGFLRSICIIKSYKLPRPYVTNREFTVVKSNVYNWLLRFILWCPSIIAIVLVDSSMAKGLVIANSPTFTRLEHPKLVDSTAAFMSFTSKHGSSEMMQEDNSIAMLSRLGIVDQTSEPPLLRSSNLTLNSSLIEDPSLMHLWVLMILLPSCLSSVVTAVSNKDFRRCFIELFHYSFRKTSVALSRRPRDAAWGGGDVRVHIIPGYNMYSSGFGGGHNSEVSWSSRFNNFKCGAIMGAKQRDVYEL